MKSEKVGWGWTWDKEREQSWVAEVWVTEFGSLRGLESYRYLKVSPVRSWK